MALSCVLGRSMVVAMSAQLLGAFFLVPGVFSEQFLACKGALDVSSHDLNGGVRSAAVAHVFLGKE